MAKIKVLDNNLVNLIAAGEIVERPASVVKELIENSLDAGAKHINVDIVRGGKGRIVVIDDGAGMSREDAEMSLKRHATSKISGREDLMAIHTLGFRGEAIPSIASVSRFKIFTRERESDQATEISVDGGKLSYVRDAGTPPGTRIVVEDLFFSIPARRKFLKTDKTEYYHVLDVVNRSALSRPDVRFTLSSDGREVINTLPGTLRERAADILGRKISERMEEIAYDELKGGRGEGGGIGLVGLAGNPDDLRSNQNGIYLYVNDRFVKDRVMVSAVTKAYRSLIARGKYPIVILFLQLPFSEVDVNIHPTKIQVKFKDSGRIHGIVKRVLDEALLRGGTVKIAGEGDTAPSGDWGRGTPVKPQTPGQTQTPPAFIGGIDSDKGDKVRDVGEIYYEEIKAARENLKDGGLPRMDFIPPSAAAPPESEELFEKWGGMTFLGQVRETYIVFENVEGLLIVDQHAAHERVVYEWLKAGVKNRNIPKQQLLFPQKLELPTREYEIIVSNIDRIKELGIELSDFGAGTVIVSSIPGMFEYIDVEALVVEMAEELKDHGSSTTVEEAMERLLIVMSCHGSIRAGKRLEAREIRALLEAMEETPHSSRCPHGRPTVITIPVAELERRFKRTT